MICMCDSLRSCGLLPPTPHCFSCHRVNEKASLVGQTIGGRSERVGLERVSCTRNLLITRSLRDWLSASSSSSLSLAMSWAKQNEVMWKNHICLDLINEIMYWLITFYVMFVLGPEMHVAVRQFIDLIWTCSKQSAYVYCTKHDKCKCVFKNESEIKSNVSVTWCYVTAATPSTNTCPSISIVNEYLYI